MLRYFEDECWTLEAMEVSNKISDFVEQVIQEQVKKGYSVRETAHVAMGAVFEAEIKAVMDVKKAKGE